MRWRTADGKAQVLQEHVVKVESVALRAHGSMFWHKKTSPMVRLALNLGKPNEAATQVHVERIKRT